MTSRPLYLVAYAALLAPLVQAQAAPDVYVCDSEGDKVWFCSDLDGNGDYNGAAEAVVFYDDGLGPVALSVNAGLMRATDGALFVTDSTEDIVLRLIDIDGNGDAHGANEATVWFDGRTGGNVSGVLMTSARGMWRDPNGVLWVASSNVVSGGNDAILRLEDLTGDGDANDLFEALEYYVIAPGATAGVSIPSAIVRGSDGALYYAENGTSANPAKGAYRLEDLDQSGTIDQPNEVTPYFIAPPQGGTAFHWEITIDTHGALYLGDNGNEIIWKLVDANNNRVIDAGEEQQYWTAGVASNVWDIDVDSDGSLYLVEDQTPDRIVRLYDADGNGVIDPLNEAFELYSDLVSGNDLGSPRALALVRSPLQAGTNYCGPAVINSTGASATMSSTGSASVVFNDLGLVASDLPQNSFGYFLTSRNQSFIPNPGGSQGTLCLGAPIGRYVGPGQIQNSGATGVISLTLNLVNMPTPIGPAAVQVGDVWNFTAWYRDALGGVAVSNFADGYSVTFH